MAIAVLEVAVLAVSYAVVAGQVVAHEADQSLHAVDAAEELMERILALPWDDPSGASALGPETGESGPANFDNTDDYHGYADVITIGADATQLSRSVLMATMAEPVGSTGATINGLTVTITVQQDDGTSWTIVRFIPESES